MAINRYDIALGHEPPVQPKECKGEPGIQGIDFGSYPWLQIRKTGECSGATGFGPDPGYFQYWHDIKGDTGPGYDPVCQAVSDVLRLKKSGIKAEDCFDYLLKTYSVLHNCHRSREEWQRFIDILFCEDDLLLDYLEDGALAIKRALSFRLEELAFRLREGYSFYG